ncbi:SAM-dependent methyltransferase [Streptosporangium carneum]|uniref:SAM-dependent methyltransferase n=1 Tax=Streptosporangium carneum TaxID=47481 RepID=A0A9W6I561_9ACTN|nr:SAM-dependent methyltransferase [Streptosporangium carneum]GLK11378.1 hypothetical protein GCM10017600_47850 [Streptosporangium carneum]
MSTENALSLDKPSPARMYDYFLHGDSNFPVDRQAGDLVISRVGKTLTSDVVWENRRFLGRVVDHLAKRCGIRQFVDVGAGLPSMENTHQVARRSIPDARVVYVDNDPAVAAYGRPLLTGDAAANVRIITADVRAPAAILDHPDTRETIDFSEPVAVLFVAVLHFVRHSENPHAIVEAFGSRMAAGSYLAISHLATDRSPVEERRTMEGIYENTTASMTYRDSGEITDFFRGFDILPPGVVPVGRWNPDERSGDSTNRMYGGVARKPED